MNETSLPIYWSGMLTIDNANQISDLIVNILNNKLYTSVTTRVGNNNFGEIYTNQKLKNYSPVIVYNYINWINLIINDSYGVWSINSSTNDPNFDTEYKNPYIACTRNSVKIAHRNPCGGLVHWMFGIQNN